MTTNERFGVKEGTDMSFSGLLGNGPRVKILEFLMLGKDTDSYKVNHIADASEIGLQTARPQITRMLRQGLVVRVKGGQGGNRITYKLNQDSPQVKAFVRCFNNVLKHSKGY